MGGNPAATAAAHASFANRSGADLDARDIVVPVDANVLSGCTRYKPVLPSDTDAHLIAGKLHVHLAGQDVGIFRAEP